MSWSTSFAELSVAQKALAAAWTDLWQPPTESMSVGGVFVCFGRGGSGPGAEDEPGWAGAAVVRDGRICAGVSAIGTAGGPYFRGYLALREGPLLERAVQALREPLDVLIVNATGRDHPRRAGLALHLGAVLDIPTIGVTHRPLLATGAWPQSGNPGAYGPLLIAEDVVGYWIRTQANRRPLAVHAGWNTSPETARRVALAAVMNSRTPEPLREARRLARTVRSSSLAAG